VDSVVGKDFVRPLVGAAVTLLTLVLAGPAGAATFTVNSPADIPDAKPGDGECLTAAPSVCTLRAAVREANATGGNDTINLPSGDYDLTLSGTPDDTALRGDLDVTPAGGTAALPQNLTIVGGGARTTTIVGPKGDRVFHVVSSSVAVGLSISGVTITGGNGVPTGGGILHANTTGTLSLTDVTVANNVVTGTANATGSGGGILGAGPTSLQRVTISGNRAQPSATGVLPLGGGLRMQNATATLTNVTVQGNTAEGAGTGGGIYTDRSSVLAVTNSTITGNQVVAAGSAGGVFVQGDGSFTNALLAENTVAGAASNCAFGAGTITSLRSLESATDCGFTAAGNIQNGNAALGPFQDNGGQTDTRALLAGSQAIDAGDPVACPSTDQRGAPRPSGLGCDIGAFEFAAAAPPPPPPPTLEDLPKPVLGRSVNIRAVGGRVLVALPPGTAIATGAAHASQKGLKFVPLEEARQIPVGSFLDTKRGRVKVLTATTKRRKFQSGQFSSGIFQVLQSRKKLLKGLTTLQLKGSSFRRCRTGRRGKLASASALSRRTIRKLRANAKGRFRTRGRHSAATVRGTFWITADRCDGTLTTVKRGRVAVRDFRRKKTILVRAGKSYLAKARG
jgi:CSLREA domain-containing protein